MVAFDEDDVPSKSALLPGLFSIEFLDENGGVLPFASHWNCSGHLVQEIVDDFLRFKIKSNYSWAEQASAYYMASSFTVEIQTDE